MIGGQTNHENTDIAAFKSWVALDQLDSSLPSGEGQLLPRQSAARSPVFRSDRELLNTALYSDVQLITSKLNTLDLGFFSSLVQYWKQFTYNTYSRLSEDQACLQDLNVVASQVISMSATQSNHLSYNPLLKNESIYVVALEITQEMMGAIEPDRRKDVANNFLQYAKIFDIFFFHTQHGRTIEETCSYLGFIEEFNLMKKMFPPETFSIGMPSLLTTSLFQSPWAETLELEQFFLQTAENFKVDPVTLISCWYS